MEGTSIGQYRVIRKLGEGGMGAVYVAEHTLIGRKAAIKVLLPQLSAHQEIVNRFFNEARAATAIADPGIVQIFDFGYHTDGSAFIVMEFLEGETLDARLRKHGRLHSHDAIRIMRQVAGSLAAAHTRGIIHRDLKPENIFLVKDKEVAGGERPKILDFGIAKLTGEGDSKVKTHTSAIMGTPWFMSPEQCRGAGAIDHRSDIYALGCVMFHLITGGPPFDGEGAGDIIASHLREPPPAPSSRVPGVPAEIDAVVLQCLQKSPDHRYQSMEQLADVLARLLVHVTSPGVSSGTGQMPATVYAPMPTPAPYAGAPGSYPGYPTPPPPAYGTAPGTAPGAGSYPGQPTTPTTLSSVASQVDVAPAAPKKGKGLLLAIAGFAVAGGVAAVLVLGGGGGGGGGGGDSPSAAQPGGDEPATKVEEPATQPEAKPDEPEAQPEAKAGEPTAQPEAKVDEPTAQPEAKVDEPATEPEAKPDEPVEAKTSTRKKDPKKKRRDPKKKDRDPGDGEDVKKGSGVPGDLDGDGIPDTR